MASRSYKPSRRGSFVVTRVLQRGVNPPVYEIEFQHGYSIQVHGGSGRSDTVYAMKPHDTRFREGSAKTSPGVESRRAMQHAAIQAVLGKLGNKSPASFFVDSDGDVAARVEGGVSRRGRGGAGGALHALKAREAREIAVLLKAAGYTNPKMWARKLVREGMGPYEVAERIRHGKSGIGSLGHSHGMRDAGPRSVRRAPPLPSGAVRTMAALLRKAGVARPEAKAAELLRKGIGPGELAFRLRVEGVRDPGRKRRATIKKRTRS